MNKTFFAAAMFGLAMTSSAQKPAATLFVKPGNQLTISRNIYGHFAEHLGRGIYDGIYKDGHIRKDIVEALKKIRIPNLRWPGGCFADRYHWREGIGPQNQRPIRINASWGMAKEDNSFGTDEFMKLCSLLGCEPYLAGNMGTGTPQEMLDWIEYLNSDGNSELTALRKNNGHFDPYKIKYFGVGNESWGCGGEMTPEYYSNLFKQYSSFLVNYPGTKLYRVACGPFNYDFNWTEIFMKTVPVNLVEGLSLHYYTIPSQNWNSKGSATNFSDREYFTSMWQALRMDYILTMNEGIMDKYDPAKKVALVVDEWGVWTNSERETNPAFLYQQNSLRDALVAASTLNIFNKHCERVKIANLAQAVNVLQALVLTKGDSILLTPTYYVFDMYKVHHDAQYMPVLLETPYWQSGTDSIPSVSVTASRDKNGMIHISLVNINPEDTISLTIYLDNVALLKTTGQILKASKPNDINTFEKPNNITIHPFDNFSIVEKKLSVSLPAKSIVALELK